METRRYKAYNSTRGTVLNSKLAVANRELEPLKFLELLIGGLGLDAESGLWLKPLAGTPQVPRVFPFDLVYLDRNERVIESAEIFPSSDFPPCTDEAASAMVLPLHAASLSRTRPGDLLTIQEWEANGELRGRPAEGAERTPDASPPEVAVEVAAPPIEAVASSETAEATSSPAVECLSTSPVTVEEKAVVDSAPPEPAPAVSESAPSLGPEVSEPVSALTESKVAVDAALPEPVQAESGSKCPVDAEPSAQVAAADAPRGEAPMEGISAPTAQAEELSTKKSKSEPKQEGEAGAEVEKPLPQVAAPSAPDASEKAGPAEKEKKRGKAPGTTASTSRPAIQSVGFTFSQYRNWQVTNATPPAAALENPKSKDKAPVVKDAVDAKQVVAQPEGAEKPAEKTAGSPDGRQSNRSSHVKWSVLASRASGKPGKPSSAARRASAARRDTLLHTAKATSTSEEPKAASAAGEAKEPIRAGNPTEASAVPAVHEPAAKHPEPSMPLWKIAPDLKAGVAAEGHGQAQDPGEGVEQPASDFAAASEADSRDRVKRSNLPVEKVAKRPEQPKIVEATPDFQTHPSRVPEAISRLMNALQRIGGGAQQQPGAKQKVTEIDKQTSWLVPEALHRDRRRAVRRAVPGLVAYYFTGGAPQPYSVSDISATGFFLVTRDQWMPETMILMTLQKPSEEGKQRKDSITVLCKVVRRGEEGIGAEFVMPETLDPNSRDIKPSRATDRMALAKFLFSGEVESGQFEIEGLEGSLEVLGFAVMPHEHQNGEEIESQEDRSPD